MVTSLPVICAGVALGLRCGRGSRRLLAPRSPSAAAGRLVCLAVCLGVAGCGQRMVAGPLRPLAEVAQQDAMTVLDDGTVLYAQDRFELGLRPLSDEELNRQFAVETQRGLNPYTYNNWKPIGEAATPRRFAVFLLQVKNYAFPKVGVTPGNMRLRSANGREYLPLSLDDLRDYYIRYDIGYSGNKDSQFRQRKDLLRQTLFPKELLLFSGMERKGYIVFPPLDSDVQEITVQVDDIVVRFNAWEEPVETLTLAFRFERALVPLAAD